MLVRQREKSQKNPSIFRLLTKIWGIQICEVPWCYEFWKWELSSSLPDISHAEKFSFYFVNNPPPPPPHSKKYQNFSIVFGRKFKGNGQFSLGNWRETEISISPLGNYRKCVRFPKISPTKMRRNFILRVKQSLFLTAPISSYRSLD